MPVLWAGGEDICFPTAMASITVDVSTGTLRRREDRTRCCLMMPTIFDTTGPAKSNVFSGGSVTDCWLKFHLSGANPGFTGSNRKLAGFGKSGGNNAICVGIDNFTGLLRIQTSTGATNTVTLATAAGSPLAASTVYEIAFHVASFGASGTATVYLNGTSVVTYTGNLVVGGISDLDQVFFFGIGEAFGASNNYFLSEFIAADEDVRSWSLVTIAPNGAGAANAWSNTYANVDEVANSDADVVVGSANNDQAQYAATNLISGSTSIAAVQVFARGNCGVSGLATLGVGVRTGGTNYTDDTAQTTTLATSTALFVENPGTADPWLRSEVDALELALRAAI